MAVITAVAVGATVAIGGGLVNANQARQDAKGFRNEAERKSWEINELEKKRQTIPNPYANITNLSGIAKDLSGTLSNPYANLGVSTQAADMQIEEADISLANTLDTLRATGSSAGGATALAQAALQSKKGVSASIEQQEAKNEQLKAQGAAELQQTKLEEQKRVQGVQMSEAQRMQLAESEGIKFKYGEQESRDISRLNRLSGQEAQSKANQQAAKNAQNASYAGMFSSIGNIAGGLVGGSA